MSRIIKASCALAAGLAISGCGGSSTSSGGPSFAELSDRYNDVRVRSRAQDPTPLADMTSVVNARYEGVTTLFVEDPESLVLSRSLGVVRLTANSETSAISGTMSDFVTDTSNGFVRATGQLNVLGEIDRTDILYTARGTLTSSNQVGVFDMAGVGGFYGPDAHFLEGGHDGDVTIEGLILPAFGFMFTERQGVLPGGSISGR